VSTLVGFAWPSRRSQGYNPAFASRGSRRVAASTGRTSRSDPEQGLRVLFVYPDLSSTTTHYTGVVSYGVASLAAALRAHGHEPTLCHLLEPPIRDAFAERVRAARPDLVAFSVNSHYARRLRDWTAWAREATGAPVVVGGVHATLAPEEVAALPAVDFTCVGEGEGPLAELCAALEAGRDPAAIPNLWVRRGDGIARHEPRPFEADLDALPDPDLGVFDMASLSHTRQGIFAYLLSRGCTHSCTYCCAHALRRAARGRYRRTLSPARAAGQLAGLLARHAPATQLVTFTDSTLYEDADWLEEFAPLYRERVGLPFSCNLRADRVDERCARLLRGMGCRTARFGVESGDEAMVRGVLRRGLGLEETRRAFALLRAQGVQLWAYDMVGLPGETLAKALRTVEFNAEIGADLAIPMIFHPYPGTDLRRACEEAGGLTGREFDHYRVGVAVRLPDFHEADVLFVQRFFGALMRLFGFARRLPPRLRPAWLAACRGTLAHPLFPRAALVWALERYRLLRHAVGERLVRSSPRLYRLLGGRDPVGAGAGRQAG
jgi:anaerobic magnesium-protoporphyrin IX monomethyl ester cyclase